MNIINSKSSAQKLRNNSNVTLPGSVTTLPGSSSVRTLNSFLAGAGAALVGQDVQTTFEARRQLKMLDDIKVTLESIMFDNHGKLYSNWSTHTWQNYSAIMTIFCRHLLAVLEDGIKIGEELEDLSSTLPASFGLKTGASAAAAGSNDFASLSSSSQSSSQPSKCSTSPASVTVAAVDENNISSQLIWSFVLSIFNMDDDEDEMAGADELTDEDTGFVLASKHPELVKGENQAKKDFHAAHKQMLKNLSEQHQPQSPAVDQFAVGRRESMAAKRSRRSAAAETEAATPQPMNASSFRANPNVNMALEWISTSLRHYTLFNQLSYILLNDKNKRLMQMYYRPGAFLLDDTLASDFLVYIKAYEQRDHSILNQVKVKTTLLIHNHNQSQTSLNRRTSSVKSSQLNAASAAAAGSFSPLTNGSSGAAASLPIQANKPASLGSASSSAGSDAAVRRPHADTQSSTSSQNNATGLRNSTTNLTKHSSSSSAFLFENDQTEQQQQQLQSELTSSLLEIHINELNAKNAAKNTRLQTHRRMHSFPNIQINMQKRNMLMTTGVGSIDPAATSEEPAAANKENDAPVVVGGGGAAPVTAQVPRFVLNNEIKEVDDLISNDGSTSNCELDAASSGVKEEDVFAQTTVFDFIQAQQIHCDRSVLDKENSHFILADIALTAMELIKTRELDDEDEDDDEDAVGFVYEPADFRIMFGRPVEKSRLETIQDEPEPPVERRTLRKRLTSVGIDIKQPPTTTTTTTSRANQAPTSASKGLDATQIIDLSIANSYSSASFYAQGSSPSTVQPIFFSGEELISSSFEQQTDQNSVLMADGASIDASFSSPQTSSHLTSSYSVDGGGPTASSKSQQRLKKEKWLATKSDVDSNSLSVDSYNQSLPASPGVVDKTFTASFPGNSARLAPSNSAKSFQMSFDSAERVSNDERLDANSADYNASIDNASVEDADAQQYQGRKVQYRRLQTADSSSRDSRNEPAEEPTDTSRLNEPRLSTVSTTSQRTRRFSWEEIENSDTAERIAIRLVENALAYYRRLRPGLLVSKLSRDSASHLQPDVPTLRQFELFIQNIEFSEYLQAYFELRSSGKLRQFYEALSQTRNSKLSQAHQSLSASTIFLSHSSADFQASSSSSSSKKAKESAGGNSIFAKLFSKSNTSVAKSSSPAQLVKTAALAAAAATSLNQMKLLAAENDPISLAKNQQLQDQAVSSLRGMDSLRKRFTNPASSASNASALIRQLSQSNFNDSRQSMLAQESSGMASSLGDATSSSMSSPSSRMSIYNNIKALNARIIGDDVWAPVREQLILNKAPKLKRAEVMAQQQYRCADCGVYVNPEKMNTFNYCEYFCKYFCRCCHINNQSYIPAYIVQSSDFHTNYRVSKKAKSFLEKIYNEPLISLEGLNPQLFADSKNIYSKLKRLRLKLNNSKRYIYSCRFAIEIKQRLEANFEDFIIENADVYSISSLFKFKEGDFYERLKQIVIQIINHIRTCELCRQQGFVCEICKRESDILYPFDFDRVEKCPNCLSCFHKSCFKSPDQCLRCKRKMNRKQSIVIPGAGQRADAAH